MTWIIPGVICGLIFGALLAILIIRPVNTQAHELIIAQLDEQRKILEDEISNKQDALSELSDTLSDKKVEIATIEAHANQYINCTIPQIRAQVDTEQELAKERIDELRKTIEKYEEEGREEYLALLVESQQDYLSQMETIEAECAAKQAEIERLRSITYACIQDNIRAAELKENIDKYSLDLSDAELTEVKLLREVLPHLKEQRPLCKMIWEGYYRNPTSDLLGRVIEKNKTSGIYKITNQEDKKIYIGQATNLAERIKTHIKAGLGIDATNNEMYKIMASLGVEHFTFEVVEYCKPAELNDREKFWIDYYQSQLFGYNQTKGGSAAHN